MEKININLFDNDFRHIQCSVHNKQSKYISYIRDQKIWDGITVFTNDFLSNGFINNIKSKIKIVWLTEPKAVKPHCYNDIISIENNVDYVLTHDQDLLKRSSKYKFVPVGGCWISEKNYNICNKNKLVNIIASNKNFCEGHKLRHKITKIDIDNKIDKLGNGYKKIENKEDGLHNYMFSIAIENSSVKNYFTEKLLDCFCLGTVPIYWGCTNISDFFDTRGMLIFNSVEECLDIVNNLNKNLYLSMMPYIKNNFNLFREYDITEDWIYKNIYIKII